jgi:two-component system, NarL family, nitrate/nitrite response regulator NarL
MKQKISESSKQILMYVSQGMTNKQIADNMQMNIRTVEKRIARLAKKLHCQNRTQLALNTVMFNIGNVVSKA